MNRLPVPVAMALTMARPSPEPSAVVPPRSKGCSRRDSRSGGTGGPSLETVSTPSFERAIATGLSGGPCLRPFSTRFRKTIAKELVSIPAGTGVSGTSRMIRSVMPGFRTISSTTIFATLAMSVVSWPRRRPPSALASCISFSDSRERRCNALSICSARSRETASFVSAMSRCVCASAAATGVRSSCAELAVKLRSASRARLNLRRRWFTASAIGPISEGRPAAGMGVRSPLPRASIPVRRFLIGAMETRTTAQTRRRLAGTSRASGQASPRRASFATSRRCASGSATAIVIVPCNAASK